MGNPNPDTSGFIPVKPGEVRNPNGRPKGSKNRSTIVREMLEAKMSDGRTYAEAMTAAVMEKGLSGDVTAWDKLFDSAWGKITDKQEVDMKSTVVVEDVTQKLLSKFSTEELEEIISKEQ